MEKRRRRVLCYRDARLLAELHDGLEVVRGEAVDVEEAVEADGQVGGLHETMVTGYGARVKTGGESKALPERWTAPPSGSLGLAGAFGCPSAPGSPFLPWVVPPCSGSACIVACIGERVNPFIHTTNKFT